MTSPTPGRKALSHDRIVDAAARALRRDGYAGVGVAEVMKDAGLTHGGFYAHFASRDALLVEAVQRAGHDSRAVIAERTASRTSRRASALRTLVEAYLSNAHLAHPEAGCPVAALVSDMPRQSPEVREASCRSVTALVEVVAAALPAGSPRDTAPALASALVGALQLARALGDNARGRAHLAATRRSLLAQHDAASGTN